MDNESKICYNNRKEEAKYEDLTLADDFIFFKVMQNPTLCKGVLEIVLGIGIERIEYLEAQKTINVALDSKSVRLDVYAKDPSKTIYNLEMQTTSNLNLPVRSRYYQSISDVDQIDKGEDYKNLKKNIVVFICTFDPFSYGSALYSFQNICNEIPTLALNDGTKKVFVNICGHTKNQHLQALIDYIREEKMQDNGASENFIKELDNAVKYARKNADWRREYMINKARESDLRREGFEKGITEERLNLIRRLLKKGKSDKEIIDLLDVTQEEVHVAKSQI